MAHHVNPLSKIPVITKGHNGGLLHGGHGESPHAMFFRRGRSASPWGAVGVTQERRTMKEYCGVHDTQTHTQADPNEVSHWSVSESPELRSLGAQTESRCTDAGV